MPSAANVKIDKQLPSGETALGDNGNSATPLRQAITIIEHKIRNLEKRKGKLESYRDMQNSGKELNSDQKTALAKINEVVMTLDFARDLYKQFLGVASSSEKEAKKQAKREASLKNQAELARLREILLVQDALNQMDNEAVREDFLNGKNGAAQLTETDLKLLDDLYPAVTPKHEYGNPTVFVNEVQAAAEHLLAVVDGKPKEVFGGTYSQIKEILGKIHESGYFDQAQETVEESVAEAVVETVVSIEAEQTECFTEPLPDVHLAPPIESLAIEAANPVLQAPTNTRPIPIVQPPPPLVIDPTPAPVQLPPQDMFYAPSQPQQPPITEMLGTGSFFFLQESEIDTPDQITTQTFTNQSFVVQQPPPPIPMPPPHFQAANMPHNAHQVLPAGGASINQPSTDVDVVLNKPLVEDMDKHSLSRAPPQAHHQPQSFYNNGYSNRSSRPAAQHSRNNGVHQGRPQPARH